MSIKITNPKISESFYNALITIEPFKSNPVAFSPTLRFLNNLCGSLHKSQPLDKEMYLEWRDIPSTWLHNVYSTYNLNYLEYIQALELTGIIEIDRHYIVGSRCRGYHITAKGVDIMLDNNMSYLKNMVADKKLHRKIQKQQSYHKNNSVQYNHEFLNYIQEGLLNYKVDLAAATKFIESKTDWNEDVKCHCTRMLIKFMERDYSELRFNDTDCRVWNEFLGVKSEMRQFISYKGLKRVATIDIRSCHPLFMAHMLINNSESIKLGNTWNPMTMTFSTTNNTPIQALSNTKTTKGTISNTKEEEGTTGHYDNGNSDIETELKEWLAMFTTENVDPKAILMKEIGYTKEQAKAAMNTTINGCKVYKRFIQWFETNFKSLHELWEQVDKKKVGVTISAIYETALMQDMGLYALASSMGLHLTYEADGCSVMAPEGDKHVQKKIQKLIDHIQAKSLRLWDIKPILVVKSTTL